MTNDELKTLYEKYPWAWKLQVRIITLQWMTIPREDLKDDCNYRLKPRLPADLPEPTEDMMNRAVYLGQGPIKMPHENVCKGYFVWVGEGEWRSLGNQYGRQPDYHYCIDINDPNADEIIALNRAEVKKPEPHLITWSAETEEAIVNDLIRQGWTPPGESEWLRLDECKFDIVGEGRNPSNPEAYLEAAVKMIQNGPASVRVRKKPKGE